jgi:hypothetical protein
MAEQGLAMRTVGTPDEAARAKARANLAVWALGQPDPQAWLRDQIDALGLRPASAPGPVGRCVVCGKDLPISWAGRQPRTVRHNHCVTCSREAQWGTQ